MSNPPPLPSRRAAAPSSSSEQPSKTLYQESIELEELNKPVLPDLPDELDSISLWAYTTSGGLLLFAFPLLFFPRLVFFLLGGLEGDGDAPGARHQVLGDGLTKLEGFLCQQAGILMCALAFLILLLTANPPPHLDPPSSSTSFAKGPRPSRISAFHSKRPTTIYILTPVFLISSATSWWGVPLGSLSTLFSVITAVIGFWGCWVCMFNDEAPHLSKTTGADKRTSGFPFYNKNDAAEIKRKFREGR